MFLNYLIVFLPIVYYNIYQYLVGGIFMEKLNLKRVVIFDGTQISHRYDWDSEFINSLKNQIKNSMRARYGQQSVCDDFEITIFTLKQVDDELLQIKMDDVGEEECDWLSSILERNYNQPSINNVVDETGTVLDDTMVFCDYWWRNLDTEILSKYAASKCDFDINNRINGSIIDKVFELALNNPNVIFVPYDLYNLENSFQYGEERLRAEDFICKLVFPFTFCGDKSSTLVDFSDAILDEFDEDLLLVEDKNRTIVKKMFEPKNREDVGNAGYVV